MHSFLDTVYIRCAVLQRVKISKGAMPTLGALCTSRVEKETK